MTTDRIAIWVRCDEPTKLPLLLELEEALQAEGYPVWFEVTLPTAAGNSMAHPFRSKDVAAFLDELAPRLLLWLGGQLEPATLSVANSLRIPVIVADAGIAMLPRMGRGWFPGKTRALLSQLTYVLARTTESKDGLVRAGVQESRIIASGPLEETGSVLPYDEDHRHSLASHLGPRPMWLAACVEVAEIDFIKAAHKAAARRAHRLLCIVMPQEDPTKIAELFRDAGLVVTTELKGEIPGESTQVHVANGTEDGGLWFRLAPVTFIGGSLTTGARVDPFHAATVGSVVVHGHDLGPHSDHFEQLINANATAVCNSPDDLGEAISTLLSAERVAKYAQAGWDVTSHGAEVLNQLGESLKQTLDKQGARHA